MRCTSRDRNGRPCNIEGAHGADVLHRSGRGEDVLYWAEEEQWEMDA